MATGGCDNPSDKIASFRFCSNCAKSNKIREAFKYCMECNGYYCQACVDRHKRLSGLKGHHLMDMSTLKSTCNMYCGKHNVVGCKSCMTSEHRPTWYQKPLTRSSQGCPSEAQGTEITDGWIEDKSPEDLEKNSERAV